MEWNIDTADDQFAPCHQGMHVPAFANFEITDGHFFDLSL
jgi:hypothetical protein